MFGLSLPRKCEPIGPGERGDVAGEGDMVAVRAALAVRGRSNVRTGAATPRADEAAGAIHAAKSDIHEGLLVTPWLSCRLSRVDVEAGLQPDRAAQIVAAVRLFVREEQGEIEPVRGAY